MTNIPTHVDDHRTYPYCHGNTYADMLAPALVDRRPITLVGTLGHDWSLEYGKEPPSPEQRARSVWLAMRSSDAEADAAEQHRIHSMPDTRLPFDAWDVLNGHPATASYYFWLIDRETRERG